MPEKERKTTCQICGKNAQDTKTLHRLENDTKIETCKKCFKEKTKYVCTICESTSTGFPIYYRGRKKVCEECYYSDFDG